jgi:uncharacterized protein
VIVFFGLRRSIRCVLCSLLLMMQMSAKAGSYEDFFRAINQNDADTVGALLQRGFDGNVRDPNGQTGLFLAVRAGALKAAQVLLDWSPIDAEARNVADESPLMLAALNGQAALAQLLIGRGADVNKPGWAPLHYASTHGHLDVMHMLLENHAYIDAASPNGSTPLMMAALYGTPAAVKLLLEAGADPTLQNVLGLTAIDFAHNGSRFDSAEIVAAFIRSAQPKGKW